MTPTPDELTKVLGVDPTSGGAWVNGSGLVWERISGTSVSGHIDAGPEHLTPWGVVHGGLYATVAESAASVGASAAVLDRGQFAVGVDNVTDFLRPSSGGRLELVATPVIQGKSEQLWEVSVTRADGKPVARSRIRLRNVDLAPRTEPPRG